MDFDFTCSDFTLWKEALNSYELRIQSLNKQNLISLDQFYRQKLPSLINQRNPNPYIITTELSQLMQWKLTRGKWRSKISQLSLSLSLSIYIYIMYLFSLIWIWWFWCVNFFRPRLLDFVSSLDESIVKDASQKAFESLPDISKAVSHLTVLKGVGPATASAILAAYAPDLVPFMSDEVLLLLVSYFCILVVIINATYNI